jgi:hypothetical protein
MWPPHCLIDPDFFISQLQNGPGYETGDRMESFGLKNPKAKNKNLVIQSFLN